MLKTTDIDHLATRNTLPILMILMGEVRITGNSTRIPDTLSQPTFLVTRIHITKIGFSSRILLVQPTLAGTGPYCGEFGLAAGYFSRP